MFKITFHDSHSREVLSKTRLLARLPIGWIVGDEYDGSSMNVGQTLK